MQFKAKFIGIKETLSWSIHFFNNSSALNVQGLHNTLDGDFNLDVILRMEFDVSEL